MSDVLTVEQALAGGVGAELDEADLQDVIDEEEAWLASQIGPLLGERTERFPLAYLRPTVSELRLLRPASTVELEQDGTALATTAYELRPGGRIVALLPEATRYVGIVEATYEPTDELLVRRALRRLVGLTLGDVRTSGMQSELMGSYQYMRGMGSSSRARRAIVRDLLGPGTAGSIRIRSSVGHGLAGALGR